LGIKFRLIPPGEFMMGSTQQQIDERSDQIVDEEHARVCLQSEAPRHRVVLTEPYYLSVHEITQHQYSRVMNDNPSWFQHSNPEAASRDLPEDTAAMPVEGVSWIDAAEFCRRLSRREDLTPSYQIINNIPSISENAVGYRLPTEAQWEFASLAGSDGQFATGNDETALLIIANISNRIQRPLPVGSLAANAFGIFDMHGNVNEWVQDAWSGNQYSESAAGITIDPRGSRDQRYRVTRGGDYFYGPVDCRSSARYAASPEVPTNYTTGFRIAIPIAVRTGAAEPLPTETRILLGANEHQVLQWAEELGKNFIPTTLNPRHGTSPTLIDAIAIPNESGLSWELHCVTDSETDFQAMWTTHRPAWRVPVLDENGSDTKTYFLWVTDIPFWQTWYGPADMIIHEAGKVGSENFSPGSMFAIKTPLWEGWTLTKVPIPGAEVRYFPIISESDLGKLFDDFRSRRWRPIRLMQHVGFDPPQFSVVFRDNPHQLRWLYEADLTETEFDAHRNQFSGEGLLPTQIASSMKDDQVRYRVIWSESRGN
jgi:formylglycine-generating enzyme required for sulfatase activity